MMFANTFQLEGGVQIVVMYVGVGSEEDENGNEYRVQVCFWYRDIFLRHTSFWPSKIEALQRVIDFDEDDARKLYQISAEQLAWTADA